VIHMNKTHGAMVKFEGPEDVEWKKVEKVLAEVAASLRKESPAERL
jgi:hypothetical protein